MIKINLVREGRAVRGAGAAAGLPATAAGPSNLNNILLVAGLAIGILVAGGWWFLTNRTLTEREEMVSQKQVEAQRLDAIIREVEDYQKRKDSLQKRINLINQLKENQKGPVRLMDQISRDLPDLVWLDKMVVAGNTVTIDGRGLNPNAIANFVENIKNDPMFEEPNLGNVTESSSAPVVYTYSMNFHFSYAPKDAAAAGTAAATGTSGTTTSGTAATSTVTKR